MNSSFSNLNFKLNLTFGTLTLEMGEFPREIQFSVESFNKSKYTSKPPGIVFISTSVVTLSK